MIAIVNKTKMSLKTQPQQSILLLVLFNKLLSKEIYSNQF